MKLELKHIAPYLPYGLKVKTTNEVSKDKIHTPKFIDAELEMIYLKEIPFKINQPLRECHLPYIKPILRPMSSMTKKEMYKLGELIEGELNMRGCDMYMSNYGMFQSIMLKRNADMGYTPFIIFDSIGIRGVDYISYYVYEWLFKNHFDMFNLIENNLAINKTKL